MMYFRGKEIRSDEMTKGEMILYTVISLFAFRLLMALIFGKEYEHCVFGIEINNLIVAGILWVIISICFGTIYTYVIDNERNIIELIKLVAVIGALSVLCFVADDFGVLYNILIAICVICIVPGCYYLLRRYIFAKRRKKRIRWHRLLRRCFRKSYLVFQIVIVFLAFASMGYGFKADNSRYEVGTEELCYADKAYVEVLNENDMVSILDANKTQLVPLKQDIYCTLSREERLNTLQVLLNCIMGELGCEEEYRLASEVMPSYKLGYYNERLQAVVVSDSILMSLAGSEVCSTLLHEAYHAYQNEMVDKLQNQQGSNFTASDEVLQWYYEMCNYIDYNPYSGNSYKSYDDYSGQALESSANEYMDQWSGFITDYINSLDIEM